MSFTAKLHIQGVGCYAPLAGTENVKVKEENAKRLLVVFPDGTPANDAAEGLCLHLNYVQFRSEYLGNYPGGYFTRYLDRELLTVNTGGKGGALTVGLKHLPEIKSAIDPVLLDPGGDDAHGRVMGKLLVEAGSVGAHGDFWTNWLFLGQDKPYSSVTTVEYSDIDRFELNVRKFESENTPPPIKLQPSVGKPLEVWVRNMCVGFPVEELKYEQVIAAKTPDKDFVLNYTVRVSAGSGGSGAVPKLAGDVGGHLVMCMGSR